MYDLNLFTYTLRMTLNALSTMHYALRLHSLLLRVYVNVE